MRRPLALIVTAGLAAGALVGAVPSTSATAAPVAVNESYPRPADGVYDLDGHGWGHGRGMSQHGAYGAATLGYTADQITSAYYPGTVATGQADSPVRVLISDDGIDTRVHANPGKLRVRELSTGVLKVLPSGPARWRAVNSSGALYLQYLAADGVWRVYPLAGRASFPGPFVFDGPATVRVDLPGGISRDYRGQTRAVRTGTTVSTVVHLAMELYLRGVVPRESPASWPAAALQSQAIAARSYTTNKRDRVAGSGISDICDTTACQVFGGTYLVDASGKQTTLESPSTTQAVLATANVVRTYEGKAIFAEFSSANGGYSVAGDLPYLRAQPDPYDGVTRNTVSSWTARLPVADLERAFPQIGSLTELRITGRDGNGEWGGRVTSVVLTGTAGSVTTTGRAIYLARTWPAISDGLKHQWFKPRAEPAA